MKRKAHPKQHREQALGLGKPKRQSQSAFYKLFLLFAYRPQILKRIILVRIKVSCFHVSILSLQSYVLLYSY